MTPLEMLRTIAARAELNHRAAQVIAGIGARTAARKNLVAGLALAHAVRETFAQYKSDAVTAAQVLAVLDESAARHKRYSTICDTDQARDEWLFVVDEIAAARHECQRAAYGGVLELLTQPAPTARELKTAFHAKRAAEDAEAQATRAVRDWHGIGRTMPATPRGTFPVDCDGFAR